MFLFSRDAHAIFYLLRKKLSYRRLLHHHIARTLEEAALEMADVCNGLGWFGLVDLLVLFCWVDYFVSFVCNVCLFSL
jgi:hypothetical protein